MVKTLEAVISVGGQVRLLEPTDVTSDRRALVTVLDEEPLPARDECTSHSERALGEDWNRPQEDAAWSHLQPAR